MPTPNVNITIQNGGLGRVVPTPDKYAGLIVTNKVSTEIPLGTPFLITTSRQVEALDAELTPYAKEQLLDFFSEAGEGSRLYVLPVADDKDLGAIVTADVDTLQTFAEGAIRILGVAINMDEPDITDSVPDDFVADLQALQVKLAALQAAIKPMRAIVGHYGFADIADIADLYDRDDVETPNVGVVINTSDDAGLLAQVGLALGRLAKNNVHINIGRVKDGPVSVTTSYVGGTPVAELTAAAANLLHDAGFIFLKTYPGRSGFYFNDDPTMDVAESDFSSLARGRTIDKALTIVYDTYLEEVNETIQVDAQGRLDITVVKYLEGIITSNINRQMASEISSVSCFIDPEQNILSTDKIEIEVSIVPVGYLKEISVSLGFDNPFTNN